MKNIKNFISYKKGYIDFCRRVPLPLKRVMSSHKRFFVFGENTTFLEKFV